MNSCTNCNELLDEKAKVCPACGQRREMQAANATVATDAPESPAIAREALPAGDSTAKPAPFVSSGSAPPTSETPKTEPARFNGWELGMLSGAPLVLATCLFLLVGQTGCGASLKDAQAKGFESIEEMTKVNELGFATMHEYATSKGFADGPEMRSIVAKGFATMTEYSTKLGFDDNDETRLALSHGFPNKASVLQSLAKGHFRSLRQSIQLQERGYKSYQDYVDALAFTPRRFVFECEGDSPYDYSSHCYGRRVIWKCEIQESNSYGVRVTAFPAWDEKEDYEFTKTVDAEGLSAFREKYRKGQIIYVDAEIRDKNWSTPDIFVYNWESDPLIEELDVAALLKAKSVNAGRYKSERAKEEERREQFRKQHLEMSDEEHCAFQANKAAQACFSSSNPKCIPNWYKAFGTTKCSWKVGVY